MTTEITVMVLNRSMVGCPLSAYRVWGEEGARDLAPGRGQRGRARDDCGCRGLSGAEKGLCSGGDAIECPKETKTSQAGERKGRTCGRNSVVECQLPKLACFV